MSDLKSNRFFILVISIGYVSVLLEDAKVYANHAKKKCVDTDDVKLAVTMTLERSFQPPPPRDVSKTSNKMCFPFEIIDKWLIIFFNFRCR